MRYKHHLHLLLLVVFFLSIAPNCQAADDQDNDAWSKLTEEHPITIDPAGGKAGFSDLPSIDTAPYYARYNKDIYFKFPRNYLLQLTNIAYGHSKPEVIFRAEMLYPSFSGATKETLQQFDFRNWIKSPNIILITGPFSDNGHPNKNILSRESASEDHKAKYGLTKTNHDPLSQSGIETYYTYDNKTGPVVVQCNPASGVHGLPTCNVVVNLNDNLMLRYAYSRDLLPQWRTIHEHVVDFINSSLRKG